MLLGLLLAVLLLSACAETVILLPDDAGKVGAVTVTPKKGTMAVLDQAYCAVDTSESAVGESYQLTEGQIRDRYGATLDALPTPPAKFILYFYFDKAQLKPQSKDQLTAIMTAYRERKSRDVGVIGHTDRSGDRQYNYDLSKRRARVVARLLQSLGMDPAVMEINSHGEENPLIPTADNVPEPRNRRVEVTVR